MNRVARLSEAVAAECRPESKEYAIRDSALRGFALRVQPSGAKTWVLRGTHQGQSCRISLGDARTVSAEEARARAHALLARGQAARPQATTGPTFAQFEAVYSSRRRSEWSENTRKTYRRYMRLRIRPAFAKQRLATITRADVARWFHRYSRKWPGGANRALAILKDLFNRAKDWQVVPDHHVNPCRGIVRNRRPPRGQLLNQEALARLGVALERHRLLYPEPVEAIRLMLLTGCRAGEIMALTWKSVRADRLVLAHTKTGPRTILMGPPVQDILKRRRQHGDGSTYVFPSPRNSSRPRTIPRKAWYAIRREAGLSDEIRLHDLRHNFASHAVMGGESLLVTGHLLGHRRAETTARYAHLSHQHLLGAAGHIASAIATWLG